MKYFKYYLLALIIIVLDHALKLWVYFNMELYSEIPLIGNWAKLHYVLNPGIAYGIEMDFAYGKLALSVIRIIAVFVLMYIIYRMAKKDAHKGLLWTLGLILGGAFGNMIDSVFYGVWLENNMHFAAPFAFLHGQVIDMLYFPMITSHFPEWFPFWGGESFVFFRPIFNIADAAISVAFFILLFRQKAFFGLTEEEQKAQEAAKASSETAPETTQETEDTNPPDSPTSKDQPSSDT